MARKCNLYRLLRHFIPRNDDVLSHMLRTASSASGGRTYRCDSECWRLLVRAIIPTESEWSEIATVWGTEPRNDDEGGIPLLARKWFRLRQRRTGRAGGGEPRDTKC
ncbi:TPA: hypothetical protein DCZ81_01050 [Candidatus Collierbacteria bacterium]|nr:hypothetical protein [Candidatus Collierbacteria bacterium]